MAWTLLTALKNEINLMEHHCSLLPNKLHIGALEEISTSQSITDELAARLLENTKQNATVEYTM